MNKTEKEIKTLFKEMDNFIESEATPSNKYLFKKAYNLWVKVYRGTEPRRKEFLKDLEDLNTEKTKVKRELYLKYTSK